MKLTNYIIGIVFMAAAGFGIQHFMQAPLSAAYAESDSGQSTCDHQTFSADFHDHDEKEIHRDNDAQEDHDTHDHAMHENHEELAEESETHAGHDHGLNDADDDFHGTEDGHGHGDDRFVDLLTPVQAAEAGITIETVQKGTVTRQIRLTGETLFDQDRVVHLVPRIPGVVESVRNKLGDPVKKGDTLAIIHSRELTDIKSDYLSARQRMETAKINFEREKDLWRKKIIPEKQFIETRQAFSENRIALQSAERKLRALEFSEAAIQNLPDQSLETLFEYRLTAPANGVIIEKNIVHGELVTPNAPVFIIADTSALWTDLAVYPRDLSAVKPGQRVTLTAQNSDLTAQGIISFVSPEINRETRTALARVELPNPENLWPAGLFVTAFVTLGKSDIGGSLVVPTSAVQMIEGKPSVFIAAPDGYFPVTVTMGHSNATHVEILSGISAGQSYVSNGAFALKSKLITSTLDSHAGHGH